MSELITSALPTEHKPLAWVAPLPACGLSVSPVGSGIGDLGGLPAGTDEWIFSFNDEGVTPSKIEWLGQDFSAAVKQQEIDDVLNAQLVADGLSLTLKAPPLAPNGSQGRLSVPSLSVTEHYLSLADMTRSVTGGAEPSQPAVLATARQHRHDGVLDIFFKVFKKGEVGDPKLGQSPVVQSLAWVLDHLDALKEQGVAGLVVDELQDVDQHHAPIVMGMLDDIELNGLPLCVVQQEPAQLLRINLLHDLIAKKERIPFIVSGLMHVGKSISPPAAYTVTAFDDSMAAAQVFTQTAPGRRAIRPAAVLWREALPDGRLVVSAQASETVGKIFRLKLAGLAVPQIAQILSKTGVEKFDLIDTTGHHNDAQLWSRAVIADVLHSSTRAGSDADAGGMAGFYFAKNSDVSLTDVTPDVGEHMHCLVRLPHAASSDDTNMRTTAATLDTQSILAEALLDRLFCGCPAHQPLLLRSTGRQTSAGFSLSPRQACGCATLTFERQELAARLHAAMAVLASPVPGDSDFLPMVQAELAELVGHGSDTAQNVRWNQQKKNNLSVIDASIGVLSRKLGWLSGAQISDRLRVFNDLLGKEVLDQAEATRFIVLTQALVPSLYLNSHTVCLKLYWSHSLSPVHIQLMDRTDRSSMLSISSKAAVSD